MTLAEFLVLVKAEGRLAGDTAVDEMLIGWLNEGMLEAAMQQETPELAAAVDIAYTGDADGELDLPVDYLKMNRVWFFVTEGDGWRIYDKEGPVPPAPRAYYGYPKSYVLRAGSKIVLEPEAEIDTGDSISLEYYKKPTTYTSGSPSTTILPERLIPFVTKFCLERAYLWHEKYQSMQGMTQLKIQSAQAAGTENPPKSDPKS